MRLARVTLPTLLATALACGSRGKHAAPSAPADEPTATATATETGTDTASGTATATATETATGTATTTDPRQPQTIADLLTLINGLPRPVTVAAVVKALHHPLAVSASHSILSIQPADGPSNPRLFLSLGQLIVTVVPTSSHIELAQQTSGAASIKGDLAFPVKEELAPSAPFAAIYDFRLDSSSCSGFCHRGEVKAATYGQVASFSSTRVRPDPAEDMPLAELKALHDACGADQSDRCQVLDALYDGGDPVPFTFPESLPSGF